MSSFYILKEPGHAEIRSAIKASADAQKTLQEKLQ